VSRGADDSNALVAAGRAKLAAGEYLNALILLRHACAAAPDNAEAIFLLGAAHHRVDQLPAALVAFERALALDGSQLQAAIGSLAVLCQLGRAHEARTRALELVAKHPDEPQVHYNAALVQEALGEFEDAVTCYDAALRHEPTHRDALLNCGGVLARLGRYEAALAVNLRLVATQPDWATAHFNVGEVCLALSRYDEALAASDQALALAPDHAAAHRDRGLALAALGRLEEAQRALDRFRAIEMASVGPATAEAESPEAQEAFDARVVHLVRTYDRLEMCDWRESESYRQRFIALVEDDESPPLGATSLAFPAMLLGLPPKTLLRLAQHTARRYKAVAVPGVNMDSPNRGERIRVGYVSSDFRDHPTSHIIAPLLARHDRARIEIYGYALCPDDGSEHRRNVVNACDHFQDVTNESTADMAERIARDGVDILVNLNGYTSGHRTALFAMRPAPVQVSYLGFPATMGAPFIDYLIADRTVVPEQDFEWYAESVAWLPHCYFSGDGNEHVPPAPPRGAVGLPERGMVYCDFNQHAKITPEVFGAWMQILDRVPDSVLWLLAGRGDANLRNHAKAAGIDPGRLVFAPRLPRSKHLARVQLADLFLDTRPCNAHTTAADALRSGVPLVTCPGDTFASRVATSLALAAGLGELVTRDLDDYTELAVALGRERDRLGVFKRHLRSSLGSLPVFDAAGCARALESAYAEMRARHRLGLPPAPIGASAGADPAHEGMRKSRRATP
jgi:protein O-GlcNAc transferase